MTVSDRHKCKYLGIYDRQSTEILKKKIYWRLHLDNALGSIVRIRMYDIEIELPNKVPVAKEVYN